jgi:predicted phage baseplate assembly protein
MIPPAGRNNIRALIYKAGGGEKGNVDKNTINVLKKAVPFVDSVYNVDDAGGGSDGETYKQIRISGPQAIKHRDKAVTREDYEWLAKKASLQVARARCITAKGPSGTVTLILIPQSNEPEPSLSQGLIRQVTDFLETKRISTSTLTITEPRYLKISITASICPKKMEESDLVRRQVKEKLDLYFHPLKGGPEGKGWDFGRDVFVSEICKVIEDIEGVDHAEDVKILDSEYEDFVKVDEDVVVSSGTHEIYIIQKQGV